jgi:hypothetical protein
MSAVLDIVGHCAEVIAAGHGDDLTLMPMGSKVRGYAQLVGENPDILARRHNMPLRLDLGVVLVSHIVHILRSDMPKKISDYKVVTQIVFKGKTLRVKQFVDDPMTSPEIEFYCTSA